MEGLSSLLDTSFIREQAAKAQMERDGQLLWFRNMLESLNAGDTESVQYALEAAITLLEKGEPVGKA